MAQEPDSTSEPLAELRINTPLGAFPSEYSTGMTLLDYYAGQALAGYLAHSGYPDDIRGTALEIWLIAEAMMDTRPPVPPSPPTGRPRFRSA